jgi:ACS family hexuronate transporter-like MFS transporter
MTVYTLWTNWTPLLLTEVYGQTLAEVAGLAWIPPMAAPFGGLLGGLISMRLVRGGTEPVAARRRACSLAAGGLLMTAAVPLMPTALAATAAIAASFFLISLFSVNLYSMPLDVFGAERAAFSVSMLTAGYGAMQTLASPLIGATVDRFGFGPVCAIIAVMPLAALGVLRMTERAS